MEIIIIFTVLILIISIDTDKARKFIDKND